MSDQHQQSQHPNQNPTSTTDLRARREKLGLTQRQLAIKARCSLNTLVNIETGVTRRGVSRDRIDHILSQLEEAA